MIIDYLNDHVKNRKELIPTVLLGFSVLCGILILWKVTGFFMDSARAKSVVKRATEQSRTDPNNVEKQLADSTAIINELKMHNLFASPPPKQHPVKEVSGIFGDQVLIQNKWYSVGESVKDAKIVAIGATSVTIMWDGKEKSFLPIQAKIVVAKSGSKGRTATAQKKEGEAKDGNNKDSIKGVTIHAEGGSMRFEGRGGPGEGFMAMRQKFENMSEQERQEFRERMRERFSRDRGGDSGGRGGPPGRRGPGGR